MSRSGRPPLAVIDASAVVELLAGSPRGRAVKAAVAEHHLFAPVVFDGELLAGLRRLNLSGVVSDERAEVALHDAPRMPVMRVLTAPLIPAAWALRHRLTAHDALYVALAQVLDCPLVTADRRLARTVEGEIEVRAV